MELDRVYVVRKVYSGSSKVPINSEEGLDPYACPWYPSSRTNSFEPSDDFRQHSPRLLGRISDWWQVNAAFLRNVKAGVGFLQDVKAGVGFLQDVKAGVGFLRDVKARCLSKVDVYLTEWAAPDLASPDRISYHDLLE